MSALPVEFDTDVETTVDIAVETSVAVAPSDLAVTLNEIAASEQALATLLNRADRLHASNIQHDASSCLTCFTAR